MKIFRIFTRDFNQWTNQLVREMYVLKFPEIWGKGLKDQMVHYTGNSFEWWRYEDDYLELQSYMIKKPLSSWIFQETTIEEFKRNIDGFRALSLMAVKDIKDHVEHLSQLKEAFRRIYPWYALCIFVAGHWREKILAMNGQKAQQVIDRLYHGREHSEGMLKINDNHMRAWLGPMLRKKGISGDYLKLMSVEEIDMLVINGKAPKKTELEARAKGFFFIDGKITPIKSFDSFLEQKGLSFDRESVQGLTELHGTVAYQGGIVKGKVKRVFNTDQVKDFRKGCILVTPMTSPEYLPAIEKAAAIVTDEGGITCHAAIVARELKKPCIMATKHATEIFEDGSIIEVDTSKGIVKKL
jgi:phosphohistidine swiveling domain-containing protein